MSGPIISNDPLYQLLRNDDVKGFNTALEEGQTCDLTGCDFKGIDLRGINFKGSDLENAYFRGADLRGIDFRGCNLNGVSLADAKISGCYFPPGLSPNEIQLSVVHGTRMRQRFIKK